MYDYEGKQYIDFSSQAVHNNLGYTIPEPVLDGITRQLNTLHHIYSGSAITESKAKLAELMS